MAGVSRTRHRADRVKKDVSISRLLHDLGYLVRPDAEDREQQFACNLHGDGMDVKPSARVYPDNNWYCFACGAMRDTIETVRQVKGVGFVEAIEWLENKYKLDPLPWSPDDLEDQRPRRKTPSEQITEHLNRDRTFEDESRFLLRILDRVTQERRLSMSETAAFWEGFDKLCHLKNQNLLSEKRAREAIAAIEKRISAALRGNRG